ncbi:fatty acid desaturase [Croceicoccus sp. YJ47]|uniref:fatty acid desaturase n=1 Tax=Croceicoccus sp. YJ47 TaxID=2798724 RepID=UPI001920C78D|nr:fatty acid desaturase [Croceicoccus sp. YJ47]QQN73121.1 fatty acid desaturase [Croceicoccus sp. YJ47]
MSHRLVLRFSAIPDTAVSIALAAGIVTAWLAIHVGAIFAWEWQWGTAPLAVLLIAVQTWLSVGLFIIAHDCMHGSLAPGHDRVQHALGTFALGAYAALSYRAMLPAHHRHHAAPGSSEDPDFHAGNPHALLPWFAAFFGRYYTHGQIVRITLVALLYMALGARLVNIAAFWAVPAVLALVQLFVFGTWLPHRHGADGFADHHNARSLRGGGRGAMLRSLLACFHFGGYHHEHHLSPGTPWWCLPRVTRRR